MRKKLLIVGSDSKWAIERFYVNGLSDFYEVDFFNARGKFLDYYHSSIFNKLIFRLGLSTVYKKINFELLSIINKQDYDIVFVFKGMELFPSTIQKIKSKEVCLVNYNPDHPFEFFSKGSGNKNVLKSIPFFDHHFSYSKRIVNDLKTKLKVSASWLPFAYFYFEEPKIQDEKFNRICFIGNPDKRRVEVIQKLLSSGIEVDVYGNNWNKKLSNHKNLKINSSVYEDDFVRIAKSYRLQLNIFRPHNLGSHNMRTFEMPAIGCLTLSPRSLEQLELFTDGEEAFYYESDEEMVRNVKEVFAMEKEDVFKLKMKAYKRCLSSDYHYKNRVKEVVKFIENII